MGTLVLLRGLPGSGKSTTAKELFPNAPHFEADMYFTNRETGIYNFDPTRLGSAHLWCRRMTENAMTDGNPIIVVSNTFTTEKELKDYFKLAQSFDYKVITMIVENRHEGENIHGVPEDKLQMMRDRFSIKL